MLNFNGVSLPASLLYNDCSRLTFARRYRATATTTTTTTTTMMAEMVGGGGGEDIKPQRGEMLRWCPRKTNGYMPRV
ncbi:hypothetical protein ALC57_10069 [Trachymyrmex cornetzi]|uniref:Uncharacterized protein n=1 Tax=Trachymyrmex cornetzi TaxID=471704 RepID=A0A195DXS1_9HYME|nr:hypothetical protein ALC57_10069 [Trachymyrmex cornetzi]